MTLVDTHCHLGWRSFDADRAEVVRRAIEAGVRRIVTVGVDVPTSRQAIELAEQHDAVYAAVGLHPNDAAGFDAEALSVIRALAGHPKVVAIGEIGLDKYWKKVEPETQARAFQAQLELAADIGKPVIIHNRDATEGVMTILERHVARRSPPAPVGILHSFFDGLDVARRAFDLGFTIGLSGPVTFKNGERLRELARALPADRFVIETDAPFLTPEPRRGSRNEPAYVRWIADRIASERGVPVQQIAERTTATAERVFGWVNAYGSAS